MVVAGLLGTILIIALIAFLLRRGRLYFGDRTSRVSAAIRASCALLERRIQPC
jgi:hypothetical protein